MKTSPNAAMLALVSILLSGCLMQAESHEPTAEEANGEAGHHEHKIVVTSPIRKDVISTQQYVCQIHSCQHIEVRALEGGYLKEIHVREGQAVKKGKLMFKILPTVYQAKLESEVAEAQRLRIVLENAQRLFQKGIVSPQEIALKKAELAKAEAKVALAKAELGFTDIIAPFDGIVDRQRNQLGSLIEEGDILTTFSDNSLMWVYFNVPEARYLEYKAELDKEKLEKKRLAEEKSEDDGDDDDAIDDHDDDHDHDRVDDDHDDDDDVDIDDDDDDGVRDLDDDDDDDGDDDDDDDDDHDASNARLTIELELANGKIFPQPGRIGAIEADFNNETGNISFRADFPNPEGLLRNGQTGTILIHRTLHDALVIPQRATYEILAKQYVFVVDKDHVVHQRDITIQSEQEDIFVIAKGLEAGDKIILEGIRQVRDGDKVEFEYRNPEKVLESLKFHAE